MTEKVLDPAVTLNNGVRMPRIGYGLWGFDDDGACAVLRKAFIAGYRMVDTGDQYKNEAGVGRAFRESGLPREELFVTTKVYAANGYDATLRAFDASIGRLGLDLVDLYLIHWPMPDPAETRGAWRAMERLLADGRVRAIGLSNFYEQDLRRVLADASVAPAVNQIEMHPWCSQSAQRALNAEFGIATEAWGPLGRGRGLLDSPELDIVAARHERSRAQVVLRWHMQLGALVIPKSTDPARMARNLELFDFDLDEDDLKVMAGLDQGRLVGPVVRPF